MSVCTYTMDTDDDVSRIEGGLVIALLDFPKGGTFGLDGQSIVLKTDDFVGVNNIPNDAFHLVTCKNGHGSSLLNDNNNNNNNNTIDTAVTVGFLVFGDDDDIDNHHGGNNSSSSGHLVRKYDPQTEEVASEERYRVDDITKRNIIQHMTDGSLPSSRVLRYDQIVSGGNAGNGNTTNQEEQLFSGQRVWREQTRYIRKDLLKDIRGLSSGDKIVPGCYDPEDEIKKNNDKTITVSTENDNDGKSLTYPSIPVVDPRLFLVRHKHHGTNRFLSRLEPRERTRLFLSSSSAAAARESEGGAPNFVWLDRVLRDCYRGSWEALLGDLQLSYVLFLYLGCYSSLAHWKDLLAMLSLAVDGIGGDRNRDRSRHRHESLYRSLLRLLPYQLSSMNDPEFLENIDEGGGNFLIPSLARLKGYYETERQPPESNTTAIQDPEEEEEPELLLKFRHVLSSKFPQSFVFRPSVPTITRIRSNSDDSDKGNNNDNDNNNSNNNNNSNGNGSTGDTANHTMDIDWGNEDEEDGPVVVSSEEIEASMARSSVAVTARDAAITKQLRTKYPLLAAAMTSSEDVLMTCARVLDEKTDVSLVREAAAYLEEMVEGQPQQGFY